MPLLLPIARKSVLVGKAADETLTKVEQGYLLLSHYGL